MQLDSIELNNFRNYKKLNLKFPRKKTLLTGKNAQGKTNLLESIYYLSNLASGRIKKDSELVMFGEERALIKAQILKSGVDTELEVEISPPKNKVLKVNGLKKSKSKDFLRVLSVVNFSTCDLLLLRGEPQDRRKWLDLAICQIYPVYAERMAKYSKIRLQKGNLLANGCSSAQLLDVFNTQLAVSGANIIFLRQKFLKELEKVATQKHSAISPTEVLSLKYDTTVQGESAKEITESLSLKLEELKNDEIRRAQCLVGPHRDDISYFINNVDSKKFASQGQQRTVVLALKLAELEIIKQKNDESPLLLLDDVLAELDSVRQNFLLSAIESDIQTIITSVDTLGFDREFLEDVDVVKIENGEIIGTNTVLESQGSR
ncbi:DNA replication and repair protein RecF [Candidatus Gastranaerophilus sp. (ex Termes propinquus)]|nr:DNA replication and repair protein RecF [Candidatus Gastranaerophilus sp. (ex Termes propinquus)]